MRRCLPLACLLAVAAWSPAAAAHPWYGRDVGLGLSLGQPTALTLEIRPNTWSAFDLAFGLGDWDDDDLDGHGAHFDNAYFHLEYLVKPFRIVHKHTLSMPVYFGIGGFISDHGRDLDADNIDLGARFPIGLAFEFEAPVELFVELSFRYFLASFDHPDHDGLDVSGALGFRIYF